VVGAGFLGFDEAVINRLSVGNKIVTRKKLVALLRQSKDLLRAGLVPFDAALLDESLVTEMLNVVHGIRQENPQLDFGHSVTSHSSQARPPTVYWSTQTWSM
jgi:hypothetical protein